MMENQQKQTKLLRQGLIAAHKEQKSGNILDFKRLQPAIFTGEERPPDVEKWLIDVTHLSKGARVLEKN